MNIAVPESSTNEIFSDGFAEVVSAMKEITVDAVSAAELSRLVVAALDRRYLSETVKYAQFFFFLYQGKGEIIYSESISSSL